jgi:phosphoglucosamine mutase
LPTPGIALVTRVSGASAGIVVSASHNPYQDNGIKVFDGGGFKLSEEKESELERLILSAKPCDPLENGVRRTGKAYGNANAVGVYADFLKRSGPPARNGNNGLKIVLDCAHGATHEIAPRVFAELGFAVEALNVRPNGININDGCGSQHPEGLARRVAECRADVGLAFDGDGDRLIAVDDLGEVLSGDRVLAVCAEHLHTQARLKNNTVVSTVMSNAGLTRALKNLGIHHLTTPVGDRHVMEALVSSGAVLGGEDSGHMIFAEHHTTGDGILTGLMLVDAIEKKSQPLSQLKAVMTPFPQVLVNVAVKSKPSIDDLPHVKAAIRKAESRLGENGRVLVRYSGTEALCRVMVEGPGREATETLARVIAQAIAAAIGR